MNNAPYQSNILVTGGAGFMGSSFIRYLLSQSTFQGKIINYDALTYCGNLENLSSIDNDPRYRFVLGNILDQELLETVVLDHAIDVIVHFAAETHVDRSIHHAQAFVHTNVLGTYHICEVVRQHPHLRLHHVSTDEVYGALGETGSFFEDSPYLPNSPYSASKAASDHFVRAYIHTYHIKATLSHAGNNYGPYQFPEKLIPCMIQRLIEGKELPLYGQGLQVREWLYVDDHAKAIEAILNYGKLGQVYNVGSGCEKRNIDLVHTLIQAYASIMQVDPKPIKQRIVFVQDRPGHDFRYAMDTQKLRQHTQWMPQVSFEKGLKATVQWYLEHPEWLKRVLHKELHVQK